MFVAKDYDTYMIAIFLVLLLFVYLVFFQYVIVWHSLWPHFLGLGIFLVLLAFVSRHIRFSGVAIGFLTVVALLASYPLIRDLAIEKKCFEFNVSYPGTSVFDDCTDSLQWQDYARTLVELPL